MNASGFLVTARAYWSACRSWWREIIFLNGVSISRTAPPASTRIGNPTTSATLTRPN
ncbi:uncharacterized protein METZ01_LOCUS503162, partial [marine metagenome]